MNVDAINKVAVIGLGTMGHGIAQNFAVAGYEVCCFDEVASVRDSLVARVRANLTQFEEADFLPQGAAGSILARIRVVSTEAEAVGPADFVTEAVAEDLQVKQQLFARLEADVDPETILASNSSSFPITQTSSLMKHPERAIVTHYFNPPHIVPIVEVVPGEKTSEETTCTTHQFLSSIGKKAIRINKEIPGFLVNRVQTAMYREIWDLLDQGIASAEDIDEAIRGSMGMRLAAIGPLKVNDFAGLDINMVAYQVMIQHMRGDWEVPAKIQQLVDEGNYGVKTGKGIYDYTPDSIQDEMACRDQRYLAIVKLFHADLPGNQHD
jgi:3-hydroxybutyryl-CoA dehydrogenase